VADAKFVTPLSLYISSLTANCDQICWEKYGQLNSMLEARMYVNIKLCVCWKYHTDGSLVLYLSRLTTLLSMTETCSNRCSHYLWVSTWDAAEAKFCAW